MAAPVASLRNSSVARHDLVEWGHVASEWSQEMSQATSILNWTMPPEVLAFAEQQGVAAYLPAVLEVTDRVFPNARRRGVVLEEDTEIADLRTIVIEVDVAMSVAESLTTDRQWHEATLRCCPTTLICNFSLSVELVD